MVIQNKWTDRLIEPEGDNQIQKQMSVFFSVFKMLTSDYIVL